MNSPHFVRPDVQTILDVLAASDQPPMGSLDAPTTRAFYAATRDATDLAVGELAVMRDLAAPGKAGPIALRLFDARAERAPGPLIVFFHGGGFVVGDLDSHAPLSRENRKKCG